MKVLALLGLLMSAAAVAQPLEHYVSYGDGIYTTILRDYPTINEALDNVPERYFRPESWICGRFDGLAVMAEREAAVRDSLEAVIASGGGGSTDLSPFTDRIVALRERLLAALNPRNP